MLQKLMLAAALLTASGGTTPPIMVCSKLSLVSDQDTNTVAAQEYQKVLATCPVVSSGGQAAVVERVGQHIAVAMYTGMLPIMDERSSQQLAAQELGGALNTAAGQNPSTTPSVFLHHAGAGSPLGLLKFGRNQEPEVNQPKPIFMALASDNPAASIDFWQSTAARDQESNVGFLSPRPSSSTCINDIQQQLPEARKYYTAR
jgi:hypothetical protein